MIFGKPEKFAITYDVVDSVESDFFYGVFNFIVNDVFYPAIGSNYTLNHIIPFLNAEAKYIEKSKRFYAGDMTDDELSISFSKQYGAINCLISNLDDYFSLEKCGVDLSPLEIADKGVGLWFFCDENDCDWLLLISNYGKVVEKIAIDGAELIELLSSVSLENRN